MESNVFEKILPPYVSYTTFKRLLEYIQNEQIPDRFDISFWPKNYSGAGISHLKKALLFFGFIDEFDNTQESFREFLSYDSKEQKNKFKEILLQKYSEQLNEVTLESGTYAQLAEKFEGTPQMKQKRIAFFIKAAQDCNVKLSKFILEKKQPRSRSKGNASKKTLRQKIDARKTEKIPPQVNLNLPDDLLRISANGEPYSSLKFDTLQKLGEEQIRYLTFWLESQTDTLKKYLEYKKAEE